LKFKLSGQDQISLAKQPTDNIEAYNLYLRGRYFWNKYNKEWVLKAIDAFEQAIAIDAIGLLRIGRCVLQVVKRSLSASRGVAEGQGSRTESSGNR
jgi:hypothetical protein